MTLVLSRVFAVSILVATANVANAFHPASSLVFPASDVKIMCTTSSGSAGLPRDDGSDSDASIQRQQQHFSRRNWLFSKVPKTLAVVATAATATGFPEAASAEANLGEVTDKVFVDISGLSPSASAEIGTTQRIVLGLFGKDAPKSVAKLKLLHDTRTGGLPAPCKPLKDDFLIQREQLEANKIYRSCVESQERGVTYDYAQVWRIVKNERIDFGSVSGKFNAREYPTWGETTTMKNGIDYTISSSSAKYLVAVRKGSDSGFGYTLFPTANASKNNEFLENYLVVGQVVEGDDVVDGINDISVVASAKAINYMAIVGGGGGGSGGSGNAAPKKDCRYGGPMYCNENKPLTKLTMFRTGIL
eukprot:CAMPEP_0201147062 /NCGR_PEP_ID=MMETSP0851-20130426/8669_1 /ASSEMBLY_ACC=CAM_ASM_000631 /TAXON_ID=183588 /ORGANISM="Pseudo-nitzschia fraudulenta, Strain WWA7" /LENGTH=359 /DNA_ID=CAMNT_0047422807 /DNA_START=109 /DNA_END=1188 /DNA_ORIENTATION=+